MVWIFKPILALGGYLPTGSLKGVPFWVVLLLAVGIPLVFGVIYAFFMAITRKKREDELWEKNSKKDDTHSA